MMLIISFLEFHFRHCYDCMLSGAQGIARFYKAKKKHIITTQTVSGDLYEPLCAQLASYTVERVSFFVCCFFFLSSCAMCGVKGIIMRGEGGGHREERRERIGHYASVRDVCVCVCVCVFMCVSSEQN